MPPPVSPLAACAACSAPTSLVCASCLTASFCSAGCAAAAWAAHGCCRDADAQAPVAPDAAAAAFLAGTAEKAVFNQYWYAAHTIGALVAEVAGLPPRGGRPPRVAFLCTPSLFFAFPAALRAARGYALLDIDAAAFGGTPGFSVLDFFAPGVPPPLAGAFDAVVVDPPFITKDCWAAAARTCRALLGAAGDAGALGDGRALIATSVRENEPLLAELLGCKRARFQPSIPHLVYQYETFVSGFEPTVLSRLNPELPPPDD